MKNHLKHLQKTFFFQPRTKNDHVNDIKKQTLLQPPREIKRQTQKPFQIQHQPRTERLNHQKDFLFPKKPHENPNFTRKSFHKQKKNILLHEKLLKRTSFIHFSNINEIKNQPFAETKSAETLRAQTDRESQTMDEERAKDTSIERESESA